MVVVKLLLLPYSSRVCGLIPSWGYAACLELACFPDVCRSSWCSTALTKHVKNPSNCPCQKTNAKIMTANMHGLRNQCFVMAILVPGFTPYKANRDKRKQCTCANLIDFGGGSNVCSKLKIWPISFISFCSVY